MSGKKQQHKKHDVAEKTAPLNLQELRIRFANKDDVHAYHALSSEVIKYNYLLEALHTDKNDFDEEKFFSDHMRDYFKNLLENSEHSKTLVVEKKDKIIGGVTIKKHDKEFEIVGLSILPKYQGKGLGMGLMVETQKLVGPNRIVAREFVSAWGALNLYIRFGFFIDPKNPVKIIKPDWLKNDKHLIQYRLVRPHSGATSS